MTWVPETSAASRVSTTCRDATHSFRRSPSAHRALDETVPTGVSHYEYREGQRLRLQPGGCHAQRDGDGDCSGSRGNQSRGDRVAQEPAPPAVSAPDKPERLLALDIFGGATVGSMTIETPDTGEESTNDDMVGWEVGATVIYGKRWLGIKSTVGRAKLLDVPVWQVTAGPQVYIGKANARWLVHALVGFAATSGVTPSRSSVVGVVGGGLDLAIFRLQADYVLLNLDGLQKNYGRAVVGVVLPLCLRTCGDYYEPVSFGR